jgi:uncharacterized protein (TIGR03067 family)
MFTHFRTSRPLLAVLPFLLLAASLCGAGDPSMDDLDHLQGKWKVVSQTVDGKPGKIGSIWTITGNKITYANSAVHSLIKLDAAKKPKQFEFDTATKNPDKAEKALQGIYEFDDDTVKFCVALPGKDRPKTFDSTEKSGQVTTVIRRLKMKKQ